MTVDDSNAEASRRRRLEREVAYGRKVHELHQKLYQRFGLLLSVLAIGGLSAPLLVALGGEHSRFAIWAAVFFVAIQAIDWKVTPGEKAGAQAAKAREFHRLLSSSRKLSNDDLEDRLNELQDTDLTEVEAVRKIAFVDAAQEGDYQNLLRPEQLKLSPWSKTVRCFLF